MEPRMRASHADRQATVVALRAHAAAGRLTEGELAERTEAAGRAVTDGDLAAVTADLPAARAESGSFDPNPLTTGLIIAVIVVAVLIGLGVLSMVAMMAFMGPATSWHC